MYLYLVIFSFTTKQTLDSSKLSSLPNDKMLDQFKLETFADGKKKVTEKLKIVWGRVENIVGKQENAGYQHFLLFPQCFQKASYTGSLNVRLVW